MKKKINANVWRGLAVISVFSGLLLWVILSFIFKEPDFLIGLAKAIEDSNMSTFECTWTFFWIFYPIVLIIQLLCGLGIMVLNGEKIALLKEKRKRRKSKKKEKK